MKALLTLTLIILPLAAHAANNVSLTTDVFVEKSMPSANGLSKIVLQAPKLVLPGDKLVYVLNYHNLSAQPAANFVLSNAVPSAVVFEGTPDGNALVSVNGGKTWGALAALKVTTGTGVRAARLEDVTNIRWQLKNAVPAGAAGKVSFRGMVKEN